MKKLLSVCLSVIMLFSVAACSKENSGSPSSKIPAAETGFQACSPNSLNGYGIISLIDGGALVNKVQNGVLTVSEYSFKEDKFTKVGELSDFYARANDSVYYGDKVYFSYCTGEKQDDDWKVKLVCVDLKKNKVEVLGEDMVYQPLVRLSRVGDKVLMYTAKKVGEKEGISYVQAYDTKTGKLATIVSKNGDTTNGDGSFITAISGYGDSFYILCSNDHKEYIEKYDGEGKLLASYSDADGIYGPLENEAVYNFDVLDDNTVYMANGSEYVLLCTLGDGKFEITEEISYDEAYIRVATYSPNEAQNVLYKGREKTIYWYKNGEIYEIELKDEGKIVGLDVYGDAALMVLEAEDGSKKYTYDLIQSIMDKNNSKKIAITDIGKAE